jgi:hypothetical protein
MALGIELQGFTHGRHEAMPHTHTHKKKNHIKLYILIKVLGNIVFKELKFSTS